jgi:hypothetical protein
MKEIHSINMVPEMPNQTEPELNNDQKYLSFPREAKLSMEG